MSWHFFKWTILVLLSRFWIPLKLLQTMSYLVCYIFIAFFVVAFRRPDIRIYKVKERERAAIRERGEKHWERVKDWFRESISMKSVWFHCCLCDCLCFGLRFVPVYLFGVSVSLFFVFFVLLWYFVNRHSYSA